MKLFQTIGLVILFGISFLVFDAMGSEKTSVSIQVSSNSFGSATFGKNLLILATQTWMDVGVFFAKVIKAGLLRGIALAFLGFILGLTIWFFLRKHGILALSRPWYRYFQWMWCVLFATCFSLGFGYAGVIWGMGSSVDHAIKHDRIADRVVANLYVAAALDAADYELKGQEKLEDIQAALKQSVQLSEIVTTNLGQFVKEWTETAGENGDLASWQFRALQRISNSNLGKFVLSNTGEMVDPWVIISVLYALSVNTPESEAFLKNNPQASTALAAVSGFLDRVRIELCKLINSVMVSQMIFAILAGVVFPLGLVGLLVLYKKFFVAPTTSVTADHPALPKT